MTVLIPNKFAKVAGYFTVNKQLGDGRFRVGSSFLLIDNNHYLLIGGGFRLII